MAVVRGSARPGRRVAATRRTAPPARRGQRPVRFSARIRVGVSGWLYAPWRGHFYPKKLPQRRELEYAAGIFNSIEINGSFYSLQRRESWQRWYAETPDDFVFAVKGSRYLTHMLRLRDAERALANFFAQGVLALKQKLGPILWQLPPQMSFEPQRIDEFLYALPHDTGAALNLARGHDARLAEREYLEIDTVRPLRHAMEIRHRSFVDPRFIEMLRKHNVALVVAETAQRWPLPCDVIADFVYIRLHGDKPSIRAAMDRKRWHNGPNEFAPGRRARNPQIFRTVVSLSQNRCPRRPGATCTATSTTPTSNCAHPPTRVTSCAHSASKRPSIDRRATSGVGCDAREKTG